MNIWLVTTGSSDIQLTTDEYWNDWYERSPVKGDCYDLPFKPTQIIQDEDEPYRVPPRVLGMLYKEQPKEVWEHLKFPLIERFSTLLKDKQIDQIIILVTDQSAAFPEERREDIKCPYWQDTCTIEPIIAQYLKYKFPNTNIILLPLKPKASTQGLDDWDEVLKLVQQEFANFKFANCTTVYVSHQAGTPAISSAVQFASLSKFGEQVEFLVSSELDSGSTKIIKSSSYLKGIRKQEAKALLDRYDYSGVKELLKPSNESELQILLDAAIQWNFAKFDSFIQELKAYKVLSSEVELRQNLNNWWWYAYEPAYLGLIRLEQENAIEAFFHTFRSVEGIISKWAETSFSDHVESNNDSPRLKSSILSLFPAYLGKTDQEKWKSTLMEEKLILSGFPLYALLRADRPQWKKECRDLTIFIEKISPERNKLFHRLKGLEKSEVFEKWQVDSQESWKSRILLYLNFVTKQQFPDISEASLMSKVHKELSYAIANY